MTALFNLFRNDVLIIIQEKQSFVPSLLLIYLPEIIKHARVCSKSNFQEQMSSQEIKRYAISFFKVAEKKKALKVVCDDLEILKAIELKFKKIFLEVNCPISTKEKRFSFVEKLLGAHTFNLISRNLLDLLAENRDLNLLRKIISCWENLYLDYKNELQLEVVSVEKLKEADLDHIKKFFANKFDKKVLLKNILDASILGGVIVKSGSFVLDNSILNKIKNIGFALKGKSQK
jgi:F-type H+-transporting ATPase subunit delta